LLLFSIIELVDEERGDRREERRECSFGIV
jgi:hypothetical protein